MSLDRKDYELIEKFEITCHDDVQLYPFVSYCRMERYEDAIRYAVLCTTNAKILNILKILLTNKDQLNININAMNSNILKQTPLHAAALKANWPVYDLLVEIANQDQKDAYGKTAADYRQQIEAGLLNNGTQTNMNMITSFFQPTSQQNEESALSPDVATTLSPRWVQD